MSFRKDMEQFVKKTKLNANLVHRKLVLDLSRRVIMLSPVDTGRFRNNWFLGIGAPDTHTEDTVGEDKATGRIEQALPTLQYGGVVYITNSLPYARPLEYGHSQQAPAGMVRITVTEFKTYIQNAVRSLK